MLTPAGNFGVEQQLPGRAELGDVGQRAPADEQVAARRGLRVPHELRDLALRLVIRLDQGGHPGGEVEPHRHHPAGAEQVAARLVVEEGVLAAADGLRVVLPGEDLPVAVEDLAGGGAQA